MLQPPERPTATRPLSRSPIVRPAWHRTVTRAAECLWTRAGLGNIHTRLPDLTVGEVEIGLPRGPVRCLLPAARDGVAVVADGRGEALRERLALAPELPPPVPDAHLVDPADAAFVGVELEVGPVRGVASHDRDGIGRPGRVHRRALHQMRARVVPFDRRPRPAGP